MKTFYCTEDGTGPLPYIDWRALFVEANSTPADTYDQDGNEVNITTRLAAEQALRATRLAVVSHVVANGNNPCIQEEEGLLPRVLTELELDLVVLAGALDSFQGRPAWFGQFRLLCPRCLAPANSTG